MSNEYRWIFELNEPVSILSAGVRIFSDGREPKLGNWLAEGRRVARRPVKPQGRPQVEEQ